jgi:hypothetical protein
MGIVLLLLSLFEEAAAAVALSVIAGKGQHHF